MGEAGSGSGTGKVFEASEELDSGSFAVEELG